mmetsp:Transcript_72791/g.137690  ORF Transcript_72791/g.137690 Transcript_72791/m.137690 type:complete len:216 (-) Transcript_72791:62-709(-)
MYGLRGINNCYAEFAGTRGDFIIVGHPEFQKGRNGASNLGAGWHQGKKLQPSRRALSYKPSKTLLSPRGSQPGLKVRAQARAQAAAERAASPSDSAFAGVDGFLAALAASEALPPVLTRHSPKLVRGTDGGAPMHGRNTPVNRHYQALQGDLTDLRQRWKSDPEGTRQALAKSGAWRYYAPILAPSRGGNPAKTASGQNMIMRANSLPAIRAASS